MVVCDGQQDALRFILKPGGKAERDIYLENRSAETITISNVQTSCDCTTIKTPLAQLTFAPRVRKAVRVAVDMTGERNYVGEFAPNVTILNAAGEPKATAHFTVKVAKP